MFRSLWETVTAAGVAVSRYPVVAPTIGDIKRAIRPLPIVNLTEASPLWSFDFRQPVALL
jgi:hypothetical protein